MILPTEQQCLDYFDEYKVPKNIFRHCLKVREVAVFLAEELQKQGRAIDKEFITCLALLHDLFKAVTFPNLKSNSSRFHQYVYSEEEITMWQMLRAKFAGKFEGEIAHDVFKDDFPELAAALLRQGKPEALLSTEEKIVRYADLRVFQEQVVLKERRFAYLRERYPRPAALWESYEEKARQLEKELFSALPFQLEELAMRLTETAIKQMRGNEPRPLPVRSITS